MWLCVSTTDDKRCRSCHVHRRKFILKIWSSLSEGRGLQKREINTSWITDSYKRKALKLFSLCHFFEKELCMMEWAHGIGRIFLCRPRPISTPDWLRALYAGNNRWVASVCATAERGVQRWAGRSFLHCNHSRIACLLYTPSWRFPPTRNRRGSLLISLSSSSSYLLDP